MDKYHKSLVAILGALAAVGVLGMALGEPRFIAQALVLAGCFGTLAVLSAKNYRRIYIPNFIIAGVVIAGNSAFYKHIEIMSTLHPLYNAIVLITGGYVLQVLLIITNYLAYKQQKQLSISNKST